MRRKDREIREIDDILAIINRAQVLRLALIDDDFPYIVPLHYGYEYKNGVLVFYMHSATEGHKLDLISRNPNVCVELDCDTELIDGGEVPCKYSSVYASVIARGKAELVDNEIEKIHGLKLLMLNQTGQIFDFNREMAESVAVIKVVAEKITAKARQKS